ncbi:MAG: thiamine pyrophosphate-dependent dehydrogenase E1 component subunit alpha, partial [Acidimicrobiia bacterium]
MSAASTLSTGRPTTFGPDELLRLFDALTVPRAIENKMLNMLRQGRISKWFSGIGQEAIAVGVASALDDHDWLLPMHRNLGVWTTRIGRDSDDLDRLLRQLFGKADGFTAGRDRTFHFGSLKHRIVGMISHLGATMPTACGLVLSDRLDGEVRVAATFCGEGASSEGDVHEAMNLAAVWSLPVIFVIENNGYGLSTPTSQQFACKQLADRAAGYGMTGEVIDGNDVLA